MNRAEAEASRCLPQSKGMARQQHRETIGVILREALRGAECNETELEPQAYYVMAQGIRLLVKTGPVTEADGDRLCRDLVDSGWEFFPDAAGEALRRRGEGRRVGRTNPE